MTIDVVSNWTFHVLSNSGKIPEKFNSVVYLVRTNWNDYGFRTLFQMFVAEASGKIREIGYVKIASEGMGGTSDKLRQLETHLESKFASLNIKYMSIGQDPEYYVNLFDAVGRENAISILSRIQDLAFHPDRLMKLQDLQESVLENSLLRSVSSSSILTQYDRIIKGGHLRANFNLRPDLTRFGFSDELEFMATPNSLPPTNVHVLIGSNGVGKTTALREIRDYYCPAGNSQNRHPEVSRVISIGFSAFDTFRDHEHDDLDNQSGCKNIGIRTIHRSGSNKMNLDTMETLDQRFNDLINDIVGKREGLLIRFLEFLAGDPIIHRLRLSDITLIRKMDFSGLSSGHKIVLLVAVSAVRYVEEKTLILIDEPESHLHPPLVAALTRAISWLMTERNGLAIIATHSPVVLQEVPKKCVWIIWRFGNQSGIRRPLMETFGENLGVLTREVFGLEIGESGYNNILEGVAKKHESFESALLEFDGQLGQEARSILRGLMRRKDS